MEKFTTVEPRLINIEKISFLKELENRPFDLALVTPMLSFTISEMYLSRVSGTLTDEIQSVCRHAAVRFTVVSKAPRLPCVKLTVTLNNDAIYMAHLFNLSLHEKSSYATLPFMCTSVSRNQRVRKTILDFIEQKFSCSIFPCSLSDTQFQWMLGVVVNESLRRNLNEGMTISYFIYGVIIHLTLSDRSLASIWDSSVDFDLESNDISWDGILTFLESLQDHFFNTYQVDMSSFNIERVVVEGASVSITKNGVRMKVSSCDLLFVLLKYIETACVKPNLYLTPLWQ